MLYTLIILLVGMLIGATIGAYWAHGSNELRKAEEKFVAKAVEKVKR